MLVAVATFRRPRDLAELLPLLGDQIAGSRARAEVLVVDNDPDGSARGVCAEHAPAGVRYVAEPRPGISAARNRALAEAARHDVLVFIDDDERPRPGWLAGLLATHRAAGGAGVVGPVVSTFDRDPDPWIRAGGFFDRRRHATGAPVAVAATNNLLLDLHVVRRLGVTFDERFGLSGGSDTLFTRTLTASGARLVWCDEAVVTDVVPAARATRSWVLRRRLRIGNSLSRTELALARSARARLRTRLSLLGRGGARLGGGALRMALGAAGRSVRLRSTGARTFVRGLGIVAGACGYTYTEYARGPRRRFGRVR